MIKQFYPDSYCNEQATQVGDIRSGQGFIMTDPEHCLLAFRLSTMKLEGFLKTDFLFTSKILQDSYS